MRKNNLTAISPCFLPDDDRYNLQDLQGKQCVKPKSVWSDSTISLDDDTTRRVRLGLACAPSCWWDCTSW